jgi:nitroreductase
MEVSEAVKGRRSIRKYEGGDVRDEDIQTVLEAGRWAPSGLNNQPWRFRVLRGKEKDSMARHTKYGKTIQAAACIAVFLDECDCYSRTKDLQAVGACIQNMLLTAHELGLGAVWLGEIINQHQDVEKQLGVEQELMAVIALGKPAEKGGSQRKRLDELMV